MDPLVLQNIKLTTTLINQRNVEAPSSQKPVVSTKEEGAKITFSRFATKRDRYVWIGQKDLEPRGKVTKIEYGKIDFENVIIETVRSTPI